MDMGIKNKFIALWRQYFNNAELPITFYYSEYEGHAELIKPGSIARCIIGAMVEVRKGRSLSFDAEAIGCPGGRKYLGYSETIRPGFEYFLSCGIPGKMEGERYKKSPELVKEIMQGWPNFKAPAPHIIFKRWDNLEKEDDPEVVTFFATSDVLSGLFTLATTMSPTRMVYSHQWAPAVLPSFHTLTWKRNLSIQGPPSGCSTHRHGLTWLKMY